jgi:hypothetical protein
MASPRGAARSSRQSLTTTCSPERASRDRHLTRSTKGDSTKVEGGAVALGDDQKPGVCRRSRATLVLERLR